MGLLVVFKNTILHWDGYGLLESWWCEKHENLLYKTFVLKGGAAVVMF
jgi:hypothetical protein